MIKIILVDDHVMFIEGINKVLSEKENIEVTGVFNSANEALDKMKIGIPDLLITDISMPELNGVEFIKIVKQLYPNLKIIVVSMFKLTQNLTGIDGYLLKETSYYELIKVIHLVVNKDEKYFYKDFKEESDNLDFNKTILTTREKEIIKLISEELTTEEIASKLFLSKHTVETHKKNIYQKLQVNNAAGLIKKGVFLGYIS